MPPGVVVFDPEPLKLALEGMMSLGAGFTGSVVGATLGPLGAVAGGVTLGTAGYAYGYGAAKQRETHDGPGVDTA